MRKIIYSTLAVLTLGVFVFAGVVSASPSQNTAGAGYATATTTIAWMTPGTATSTTIIYDSNQVRGLNQSNQGNTWATDSAILKLQINASSTLTKFRIDLEYADGTESDTNCATTPASCAWYRNTLDNTMGYGTTTNPTSLNDPSYMTWQFASSTVGGVPPSTGLNGYNGTNNRDTRIINVSTPTRYVRAVISVTGANGGIWGWFIPKKEVK